MNLDQQLVVLPKKLRAAEGFTEPLLARLLHAFNFRVSHANQVRNQPPDVAPDDCPGAPRAVCLLVAIASNAAMVRL